MKKPRLSTRAQVVLFVIAAYVVTAILAVLVYRSINVAVAAEMELPMCMDPYTEPKQVEPADPMTKLLAAIQDAAPYVAVHRPQMRKRMKEAGMAKVPEFDPNAKVLTDLRAALDAVMNKVTNIATH